jgi:hypothetical protein
MPFSRFIGHEVREIVSAIGVTIEGLHSSSARDDGEELVPDPVRIGHVHRDFDGRSIPAGERLTLGVVLEVKLPTDS